ncbi:MAG: preprotein translocase subunit SecY [Acidimicrobiia bacterium]|nr:preprotein translocase subunit SecY [Acidimicrobiia bacterium]
MLAVYRHMFTIPDLRKKILFTLMVFVIYRFGAAVTVPGADLAQLKAFQESANDLGIVGLLNLFSGGGLQQFSVFALGILPYITSSIIMQLLTVVIPRLQKLQEEGQSGTKVITQWTRYLTVILALLQSTTISFLFSRGQLTGGFQLVSEWNWWRASIIVLTMTAGTALIMWLGEQITARGVGNGMSLLIFISIISQLPTQFGFIFTQTVGSLNNPAARWTPFILIMAIFAIMVVAILYVDQGQRRIPIQFAKRVRGRRVYGGNSTYIPLKVNTAGVIPVIFASSVLTFPALLVTLIPSDENRILLSIRAWVDENLGLQRGTTWFYIILLFSLVVFFTYFYTAIQFDPKKQADILQRQGGFVPGVRPGTATERHLEHILNRITLPGALFLGFITIAPSLVGLAYNITVAFSGVSLLIVVGVALETMKQIESQLTLRNYEGFLT